MSLNIPFIPATAPFTPDQRAWLNGYFVGLLSTAHNNNQADGGASAPGRPLQPLLIAFGSQTGTAEQLAKRIAKESANHGYAAQVKELNSVPAGEIVSFKRLLIVTSTWGDGDAPDNATQFLSAIQSDNAPRLTGLDFSVLALGDRNYGDFCGAGRKMDERLEKLGARRVQARADCDVDYEPIAKKWIEEIWAALAAEPKTWSKSHPFPARLITNKVLNAEGSSKETRHIEFSLAGSGLTYEPGDALGVLALNCGELVREVIELGGWNPKVEVELEKGQRMPFDEALTSKLDLRKPGSALLDALAKTEGCENICDLLTPEKKASLQEFIAQREVIDLLMEFPKFRPDEQQFVTMLGKLHPRLYSISSSISAFPEQVHLTVSIVRYETRGRKRKGLCSTFLAERAGETVPIFFQTSHGFRLPKDPALPVIMVGPGTGIAPFRAFLYERKAMAAPGKNWLFFGDQRSTCDFLYRDELEALLHEGMLARLDTAFSRDQQEKIYVQDRMRQNAAELFAWLEAGAHFYVCGDAKRMAKDVDQALHQVLEMNGKSSEEAVAYVQKLKQEKRYQRDVY